MVSHVLKQPKPGWALNSGYESILDASLCAACGICIERCPSEALTMGGDGLPAVNLDRCLGCGARATGCPEGAVVMGAKSGFPEPPRTVKDPAAALRSAAAGPSS